MSPKHRSVEWLLGRRLTADVRVVSVGGASAGAPVRLQAFTADGGRECAVETTLGELCRLLDCGLLAESEKGA